MDERERLAARVAWSAPIGEDCRHSAEWLDVATELRGVAWLAARAMAAGDVLGAARSLAAARGIGLDEWVRLAEASDDACAYRRTEAGL